MIGSFLINNTADNDGGAIYSNGDLNLMGTSFAGNQTGNTPGRGGAVYMTGCWFIQERSVHFYE